MMWLYFCALVFLLGAETTAAIRRSREVRAAPVGTAEGGQNTNQQPTQRSVDRKAKPH